MAASVPRSRCGWPLLPCRAPVPTTLQRVGTVRQKERWLRTYPCFLQLRGPEDFPGRARSSPPPAAPQAVTRLARPPSPKRRGRGQRAARAAALIEWFRGGGSLYLTIRGPWPRDLPNQYVPGVPKAHLIGRPAGWSPLALALAFSFAFPVAFPFGLLLVCPA